MFHSVLTTMSGKIPYRMSQTLNLNLLYDTYITHWLQLRNKQTGRLTLGLPLALEKGSIISVNS